MVTWENGLSEGNTLANAAIQASEKYQGTMHKGRQESTMTKGVVHWKDPGVLDLDTPVV